MMRYYSNRPQNRNTDTTDTVSLNLNPSTANELTTSDSLLDDQLRFWCICLASHCLIHVRVPWRWYIFSSIFFSSISLLFFSRPFFRSHDFPSCFLSIFSLFFLYFLYFSSIFLYFSAFLFSSTLSFLCLILLYVAKKTLKWPPATARDGPMSRANFIRERKQDLESKRSFSEVF